jgi:hypothetical protein
MRGNGTHSCIESKKRRKVRLVKVGVGRRHWYKLYWGECPVCGRDQSHRERVYGRKPADPADRMEQLPQTACPEHFT